ncbi:MAG: tRNA (adenosine(37)-N6)-dimethylallyltransferase MiaA [Candidatus Berkelbacteria bacterium]|nr:tRNA (adenosine(37)-N6)-dimethylallyltransferase MiaA [Candidatus Berkelbacteria bacterium]
MNENKRKIIAIVGPTASGKTGIGVDLARKFNGEIISADSRQVYRRLNIGSGKDLKEYGEVKYHLIDIVDPGEKMTLFDYLPLARAAIEDIFSRGKVPIIVGGTGLYVQGIVEGFELKAIRSVISTPCETKVEKSCNQKISQDLSTSLCFARDDKLSREQLNYLPVEQLNKILLGVDPEKYEKVDHKNAHRLIRAIELAQEGLVQTKVMPDFEVLQIAIDLPRQELFERIDRRVDERFEQGMLEEVIGLIHSGVDPLWLLGLGLEYREITSFLIELGTKNNELGEYQKKDDFKFGQMSQQLKFKIHQFARRQLTWLRRFPEVNWLSRPEEIERFVRIFLSH